MTKQELDNMIAQEIAEEDRCIWDDDYDVYAVRLMLESRMNDELADYADTLCEKYNMDLITIYEVSVDFKSFDNLVDKRRL